MKRIALGTLAALAALALSAAPASATTLPAPFNGLSCSPEAGVTFCQGGYQPAIPGPGFDRRIPTFDGVPLDVDVTLPGDGTGGSFPTIVFIHGWGGSKTTLEASSPDGDGNTTWHWNNVYYAQHGYAVINYTARGFGNSCGSPSSRTPNCTTGWIHLDDRAFEARDAQYLLGLMVDAGLANPGALGATGNSYGGGLSLELAYLRNRTATRATSPPFGGAEALVPWVSPSKHIPLSLTAAYPRWLWSDLVSSLLPNGHFLDFDPSTAGSSRSPVGIPIQSYIEGLFALGASTGYYAPAGLDPGADLIDWHTRVLGGDPTSDPETQQIINEIYAYHGAYGLDGTPAPILLQDGFTDDLFPPAESLRIYQSLRQSAPSADVALQFGDLGHSRGQNKPATNHYFQDQGSNFFDSHLKGSSPAPAPAPWSVTTFTQTCPASAPPGGPFTAGSWSALHPGAFRWASAAAQSETSTGGNPKTGATIDPIANMNNPCATVANETAPGTAVYPGPAVTRPFTMMGLPTVTANVAVTGNEAQLDSRLWDVAPSGQQTLVSRGAYRLSAGQTSVTFQLRGNGWRFDSGHVPKLELLGEDPPYLRPNNEPFSVSLSNVVIELPTIESPGFSRQIVPPVLGRGGHVGSSPSRTLRMRLIVRPSHTVAGRRVRFTLIAEHFAHGHWHPLSGVTIRFAGHRVRTGRHGRAYLVLRMPHAGRWRVVATRRGYAKAVRYVTVRRRAPLLRDLF